MGNEPMKNDAMNNEPSKQQPKTTVRFYGKKLYSLNPAIGRRKALQAKLPNYEDESMAIDAKEKKQKQSKK